MKLDRKMKNLLAFIFIAVASLTLSMILMKFVPFMKNFELSLVNYRFGIKDHKYGSRVLEDGSEMQDMVKSDILILGIDEKSVSNDELYGMGPWPWNRSVHGELLNYFREENGKYAPQYVFFDIFFDYIRDAADDQKLFDELKNHNNALFDYMPQLSSAERFSEDIMKERLPLLLKDQLFPVNPQGYYNYITPDIKPPVKEILSHALGAGSAGIEADSDGVIRRMPLVFAFYDERLMKEVVFLPTIDMSIIMNYFNVKPNDIEIVFGKHIQFKNAKIPIKEEDPEGGYKITGYATQTVTVPIDNQGKMMINYQGLSNSFEYFSYGLIKADFEGRNNNSLFKNKIVLIGFYSSAGLGDTKDYHTTPYDSLYGIEIHANALYTLMNQVFIHKVPAFYEYLFMILLIVIISFFLARINIIKGLLLGLFTIGAIIFFETLIFSKFSYLGNMTQPLASVLMAMLLTISYKVMSEEKDKRFLKATFSQYISPELIDIMYTNETKPQLGGSSGILSAYFTDIQSFSTFSEKLTATQLVELLNEYLSAMTDILLAEQGTLDKYEGDAIIAFFGAPLYFSDNAVRACKVAIQMQKQLDELRVKWANEKSTEVRNTKNLPESDWVPGDKWPKVVHDMRMRIGINTGEIVTGNMGSKMRMNYTMMGDTVNLAARLESGAKQYGIYNMISENTYNYEFQDEAGKTHKVSDFFEVRFLDKITVVGKSLPVAVYELISYKGELTDNDKKLLELYNKGMEVYLQMKWDEAIAIFQEALQYERFPKNKTNPTKVFLQRAQEFKLNPPVTDGKEWDGVYRLDSK
ncbi:MAG TPA: adenylate/guanylate cyclase domain-containing protein [Spirochaetia bacterium]|nr:MAG: hypothetical protein A2Y41_11195 [Spirochaetes bacterium GWB1_36_13]HCL56170.1 adenylate/guanylate cyclase domain-containing protein [Spirochaetia bacterium]